MSLLTALKFATLFSVGSFCCVSFSSVKAGKAGGFKKDAKLLGWISVPGPSSSLDSSFYASSPDDEDNNEGMNSSSEEAHRIPEDVLSKILLSIVIQWLILSFASATILPVGFFILLHSL